MIVYSHSSIIYWWSIWATSFGASILSFSAGERVDVGGYSAYIYGDAWLHVLFVVVVAVVMLFTNVRIRGIPGYVVFIMIASSIGALFYTSYWERVFVDVPGSFLALSGSFYAVFGIVFFVAWFLTVFIVDRATYLEVERGQVTDVNMITGETRSYPTLLAQIRCERTDPLVNFVLGMGWIGFGTADIRISVPSDSKESSRTLRIPNVWRGRALKRSIQERM